MSTEKLERTLKELHTALTANGPLTPELEELLRTLDSDIRATLVQQRTTPAQTVGLSARAQAISARFAAQHPRMEPVLRELADVLERIGI
jgi:hypothetical protein